MQIYLENITDNLRLTFSLDHMASPAGTYVNPDQSNTIDNLLLKSDVINQVVNTEIVSGKTDSKLYAIINTIRNRVIVDPVVTKKVGDQFGAQVNIDNFDVKNYLNQEIRIAGTNISAIIYLYETDRKEYALYTDTAFPIKYVDFSDNTTTFMFSKVADENSMHTPLLNTFVGLVEEPKVESSVFIERGIVNAFEPFTKLKKIKSLNELTKFGFGYFKINKEGFNF